MPALVHLTDGKDADHIQERGLMGLRACFPGARLHEKVELARAVFAMPMLPNESARHQWITELLARGYRSIVAVHFRLDAHAKVWVGRERREHLCLPACDAVARMEAQHDLRGWEIVIPGNIPAGAILEVRAVPPRAASGQRLDPCEPGSHAPERLSPSVEPRLPI